TAIPHCYLLLETFVTIDLIQMGYCAIQSKWISGGRSVVMEFRIHRRSPLKSRQDGNLEFHSNGGIANICH
ncbi:MAG: hypothetical protein J0626_01020, partial [Rhodospirillaceae bacterium]|nr:hypothetical protein [Rhodospirillaceae bacterium]